ncbi:MAG: secondary thiamine-phosphate synthase enzyme YjbQ [Gammaproteobacteria bacterium]|nr:secondary thiamine-phosphate synthase enzyme YjbQ [Gammaproteobacteria bacterium]MCW9031166.1 secondary thiamine-phosphate synthase enzyme YjbQ [Gammaproteobacteria bacterium]
MKQQMLNIETNGRGTYEISKAIQKVIDESHIQSGLCHLFLQHTSASLILCENADASVRTDLENFMARIAPDGDPDYHHDMEGPDDMPAHIRTILTQNSMTIPVAKGRCLLGTWQGIYLWEHRSRGQQRKVVITLQD